MGLSGAGFLFGRAGRPRSRAGFFSRLDLHYLLISNPNGKEMQGFIRVLGVLRVPRCSFLIQMSSKCLILQGFGAILGSQGGHFQPRCGWPEVGQDFFRPGPNENPVTPGPGPAGPPRGRAGLFSPGPQKSCQRVRIFRSQIKNPVSAQKKS